MNDIAFIFTYDSYLRASLPIAAYFRDRGFTPRFFLYAVDSGEAQIAKTRSDMGDALPPIESITTLETLLTPDNLSKTDALFFAFGGPLLRTALRDFHAAAHNTTQRPTVISLYPGIRAPGQIEGFAARAASDIVLFNNHDDFDEYADFCADAGVSAENGILFGLPAFSNNRQHQRAHPPTDTKNIWFIDQAELPRKTAQKKHLAQKLVTLAQHNPDKTLTILMKNAPGFTSAHTTKRPIDAAIKRHCRGNVPKNLRFLAGPVAQVFENADLCIAISSTVAMECMTLGIPAALIKDFGISLELGNGHYRHSGCMMMLDELINGAVPQTNSTWANRHLLHINDNLPLLEERIMAEKMAGATLLAQAATLEKHVRAQRRAEITALPPAQRLFAIGRKTLGFLKRRLARGIT
ncbi:MAG: hypothetical protein OXT65_00695 [Alphaproteobacteria bacterium]|nr:hypothetical protein [Alphaproteobacteria bacterium]